ncbi:MAG TPA: hypothetical protein DDY98_04800, partial [Ruminococcaceae bacterium]|nr:hypothetical protein [Oscillospiraceae bacterium]
MSEYIAPQNAKQELVCKAMEKVLRRSQVGISDDFFNLGADAEAVASLAKLLRGFGVASADIMNGRTPEVIAGALCDMTELYRSTVQGRSRAPLTDSQLGIYLECVANPESTMYNNPIEVVLSDATDCSDEDIKQKIDGVLRLHPALYARFEVQDDTVYMVREPFPKEGICKVCNEIDFSLRPFELNAAPLCRCSACRKGGKLTVFIEAHHTVEDGTSVAVLIEQIAQAFAGLPLEEEKVDAFSIYEAEQAVLQSGIKPKADAYFEALLSDVDTDAGLLPDFKSDNKKLFPVRRFSRMLDTAKAEKLSDGKNITKSTLFMGVFGYTMLKYAGSESTVISAAETGRRSSLLDHTVSMFVRTLPVVIRPDEEKTGTEFLRELQVQFNDTFAYDFVSYGDLARTYGINADNAFVYQSSMFADETVNGISVDVKVREYGHAFAKLSSSVLKSKDGYELRIDYRSDLYTEETLDGFAQTYQLVLDSILDDVALKDIRLVNEEQENKLDTFNSTLPLDKTETFVKGFKRNYIKYGEKTALVFKDRKYTYLELNDITDRLAVYLHRHGIGRDAVVSILIPRCDYMAILSLAVLKAGGIYEPLDPNYPPERLNFMCKDARTRLLIAERSLAPLVSEYEGEILYLDEMDALLAEIDPKEAEQIEEPTAEDTYVLLYTSGTTGTPKGCMLTHRNIMSFIDAYTPIAEITSDSKTTSYASYGFDAHMADLYPSLYNGCELHIIPDEIRLNFPELKKYFEENGITNCCMTTQVARQFASEYDDVKDLKYLVAGGEKLIPYPLNDSFHIINAYGPTECTICVTMLVVDREYDDIPIGKPMPNNHIFVVDKFGRRLPVGAPGELIICGPQVGKGYLNRREQTEKVFVPNTYEEAPDRNHQNCYKTGDIVRYLPDGNIQFIGRRDLQVKIRGYRIELSEVEKVIRDYPAVTDATVIAVDDHGGKVIHAYFVAREPIEISDLEKFIKSKKPAYMVPAASMQLERIPLTVNQKVDKRKLPPIETASKPGEVQSKREMTDIEKAIVEILKDIVGDGEFGVEADFESLGITSISSIKLATKIYKKFGVNISSASILDGGTILSVENIITASLLQSKSNTALEEPKKALRKYPLTQVQMGIYLDCMRAGMGAYNIPLLIALPEGIDKAKLKQAIQTA